MTTAQLIERFSSSQGWRDQGPNRKFAAEISLSKDLDAVKMMAALLESKQPRKLENDMLLCLATLSEMSPDLVAPQVSLLLSFLESTHNRSIWGAMITLSNITPYVSDIIYANLSRILKAMDSGTVVTRDHGYDILMHLYKNAKYQEQVFPLIFEQILGSPDNQLGQYAEKFLSIVTSSHLHEFSEILESRSGELENPSHKKRMARIIKKTRQKMKK